MLNYRKGTKLSSMYTIALETEKKKKIESATQLKRNKF